MIHFAHNCRLCTLDTEIYSNLNDSESNVRLWDKLLSCIPEYNSEFDSHLPTNVCESCYNKLNALYEFKQKCLRSKEYFIRYLKQFIETEPSEDDIKNEPAFNDSDYPEENKEFNGEQNCNANKSDTAEEEGIKKEIPDVIETHFTRSYNTRSSDVGSTISIKKETIIVKGEILNDDSNAWSDTPASFRGHIQDGDSSDSAVDKDDPDYDDSDDSAADPGITFKLPKAKDTRIGYRMGKELGAVPNPEKPNEFVLTHYSDSDIKVSYIIDPDIHMFFCLQCKHQFSGARALMQHMLRHVSEKKVVCNVCGKRTFTKSEMTSHKVVHLEGRPVLCTICNKSFKTISCLKKHNSTHNKRYVCDHCGKCFSTPNLLKDHRLRISSERNFVCDTCGASFKVLKNLKRHNDTHLKDRPMYECKLCFKKMSSTNILRMHMRRHEEHQQHKCDLCKKCFNTKISLRNHIRLHTGDKPHKCPHCAKRFRMRKALDNHIRVHTGEKPFGCEVCGKRFNQAISLHVHKRTHTGEKPYQCKICGKAYAQSYGYKQHLKKIHPGEEELLVAKTEKLYDEDTN